MRSKPYANWAPASAGAGLFDVYQRTRKFDFPTDGYLCKLFSRYVGRFFETVEFRLAR